MRYIVRRKPRSVWKGLVAGLAGGFAASWTMNQFQKMLAKAAKAHTNGQGSSEEEDITGKTADTIYHAVSGKRLSREGRRTGGSVVHYVFGTAMGGAYGAAAEVVPRGIAASSAITLAIPSSRSGSHERMAACFAACELARSLTLGCRGFSKSLR